MVIDCRRSNCYFAPPKHVSLCSGASLSRIELGPEDRLYTAQCDVSNCFYNLGLPVELRRYFGLMSVRAGDMGIDTFQGKAVGADHLLYVRMCVVPMGWSWALWWAQGIAERAAHVAGHDDGTRLRDGRRVPDLAGEGVHVQYVDNYAALSLHPEVADRVLSGIRDRLRQLGLPVHEEEVAALDSKLLGWSLDGAAGEFAPTSERVWKCRFAIDALLSKGRASGDDIRRVVGHLTFLGLVRRESLSMFCSVYKFMIVAQSRRIAILVFCLPGASVVSELAASPLAGLEGPLVSRCGLYRCESLGLGCSHL